MAEDEWKMAEPEEKEYTDEDYEADRVWGAFRREANIDLSMFATADDLVIALQDMITSEPRDGIQGSVGKFKTRGVELLIEEAKADWEREVEVPEEAKEVTVPPMEIERGPPERRRRKVPKEERPSLPEPTAPTPYVRPMEIEVTEIPKEQLPPEVRGEVEVPEVRVPGERRPRKPKVAVPLTVPPAVTVPAIAVETPSQRIIRIINDITRSVAKNASPQNMSITVTSAGARVRDAITDSVNWIRNRIKSLTGG